MEIDVGIEKLITKEGERTRRGASQSAYSEAEGVAQRGSVVERRERTWGSWQLHNSDGDRRRDTRISFIHQIRLWNV